MSTLPSKTSSMVPIKASTWLVTGINRGLGRSIAEVILKRGGKVAGTVRKRADVSDLEQQFPGQLWVAELDVSNLAKVPQVFEAAVKAIGRIHAVVSNAGYSLMGAAEELELDAIRHIVDTNLLGSIQLARAAVAHMRPLGGGRIIQISSGAGQSSFPGLTLYCATKWGLEAFFEGLSQEVSCFGIGTTLVEPGAIRTDFGATGVLSPKLDAYQDGPVGMLRQMAKGGYLAPGDPVKMASAIVDTFEAEVVPARLSLGADAYHFIKTALHARLGQLEAFKNIETDCDAA